MRGSVRNGTKGTKLFPLRNQAFNKYSSVARLLKNLAFVETFVQRTS